jgi:hypothetical protein
MLGCQQGVNEGRTQRAEASVRLEAHAYSFGFFYREVTLLVRENDQEGALRR